MFFIFLLSCSFGNNPEKIKEIDMKIKDTEVLIKDFKLDEAKENLSLIRQKIEPLKDGEDKVMLEKSSSNIEDLYTSIKERHIGGKFLLERTVDKMSDDVRLSAQLNSENSKDKFILACDGPNISMKLQTEKTVSPNSPNQWDFSTVFLKVRFGKNEAKEVRGTIKKVNTILEEIHFNPNNFVLYLNAYPNEIFLVEYEAHLDGKIVSEFDLKESDLVIDTFLKKCLSNQK